MTTTTTTTAIEKSKEKSTYLLMCARICFSLAMLLLVLLFSARQQETNQENRKSTRKTNKNQTIRIEEMCFLCVCLKVILALCEIDRKIRERERERDGTYQYRMEINAVQVEPFHSIQITHFGHGWNESPLELKKQTNGANSNQSIMKINKQTNKEETIPKKWFHLSQTLYVLDERERERETHIEDTSRPGIQSLHMSFIFGFCF